MSARLSPEQQAMVATWEAHTAAEFTDRDIEKTMATMARDPFVNHVPVMTGGVGASAVREFYAQFFLPAQPADTAVTLVHRTVASDCIVDELRHSFTHDMEMPWLLPGVPPTGRRIAIAVIVVVQFEGDRIAGERIYWDQASVLAQAGLIDAARLPVTGPEAARKVANPGAEPSNALITPDRA